MSGGAAAQARGDERRRRQRARAERRARDRALAPITVAQRLRIPVADLARAMRAAGVGEQLTEGQSRGWNDDPTSAPQWLAVLRGERLARAAAAGCRRQQEIEQRQMRELAAEHSALTKIQTGKRRFRDDEWDYVQDWAFQAAKELVRGDVGAEVGDFEHRVLRLVGVDAADHSTWPVHVGGCHGAGREHCAVRIEEMRAGEWFSRGAG